MAWRTDVHSLTTCIILLSRHFGCLIIYTRAKNILYAKIAAHNPQTTTVCTSTFRSWAESAAPAAGSSDAASAPLGEFQRAPPTPAPPSNATPPLLTDRASPTVNIGFWGASVPGAGAGVCNSASLNVTVPTPSPNTAAPLFRAWRPRDTDDTPTAMGSVEPSTGTSTSRTRSTS